MASLRGNARSAGDAAERIIGRGKTFFADSVNGVSGNGGTDPTSAKATVAQAVALCTAGQGDVIVCLPGHVETISDATTLILSVSGVRVISQGPGTLRATFTLDTATTATVKVTAASVTFENCIFVANFADIVACFTLTTAKDFTARNCEFRDTSSVLNFLATVVTDTTSNHADGLTVDKNKRIGAGATTSTTIVSMLGTNDRLSITDNYFSHAAVTGGGLMIIATGKVVTNAIIRRNVCNFVGATSLTTGTLITTNGSTNSGVIADNYVQNLDATTEILCTASSGFVFFSNLSSAVADKSGYIVPAQDS